MYDHLKMAAESSTHLWDINGSEIITGESGYDYPFDEEFKRKYTVDEVSAWAWKKEPNEYDREFFISEKLPDDGKGYGILYLLVGLNGDVVMVPVLPSQEEEVAEWLKPKFPYPASVLKKQKAEKKEK